MLISENNRAIPFVGCYVLKYIFSCYSALPTEFVGLKVYKGKESTSLSDISCYTLLCELPM